MKIYSIIVCYNPSIPNLVNLCKCLQESNVRIILVDNSIHSNLESIFKDGNIIIERLGENFGIAKAQNIGIRIALSNEADVLLFFDQDSEIQEDFVSNLLAPMDIDKSMVVAPVFYDKKTNFRFPNYKLNNFGLLRTIKVVDATPLLLVDVTISSGSAVSARAIMDVGLMNEDFFIDFVDTEWSLRCRIKNIPIIVNNEAKMIHSIGSESIDLHLIRLFVHSHNRTYYKIRNSFLFLINKNVPLLLGVKELLSALVHNFLVIFFIPNKWVYLKIYFMAIRDGILMKKGKNKNEL